MTCYVKENARDPADERRLRRVAPNYEQSWGGLEDVQHQVCYCGHRKQRGVRCRSTASDNKGVPRWPFDFSLGDVVMIVYGAICI
jgi:hypothetical protein